MSRPQEINDYITSLKGKGVCDDCIKIKLSLSQRQMANQITGALATTSDFNKCKGMCSFCKHDSKLVTSKT